MTMTKLPVMMLMMMMVMVMATDTDGTARASRSHDRHGGAGREDRAPSQHLAEHPLSTFSKRAGCRIATAKVRVTTGDIKWAGTDGDVRVQLIASSGSTDWTVLDKPWYDDFEQGDVDTYDVCLPGDIGQELRSVRFKLDDANASPDWYLQSVLVMYRGKRYQFSANTWFTQGNLTQTFSNAVVEN